MHNIISNVNAQNISACVQTTEFPSDNKSFSHAGISNTWCQAQYLFQTLPIIKIVLLGLLIALQNKSMQEME